METDGIFNKSTGTNDSAGDRLTQYKEGLVIAVLTLRSHGIDSNRVVFQSWMQKKSRIIHSY